MDPLNYIHTDGAGTLLEVKELFIGSCILGSVIYYRTVEVPIKGVIHIYLIKIWEGLPYQCYRRPVDQLSHRIY
jgi:hypothetical protein